MTSIERATGGEMEQEHWEDSLMLCFGLVLDGRAQATGIRERANDVTILIIFNACHDVVNFTLPKHAGETAQWRLWMDTNRQGDFGEIASAALASAETYDATGRSMVLFSRETPAQS